MVRLSCSECKWKFWICFPAFGTSIPSGNLSFSVIVAKRQLQILLNFEPWIWWKKEENLICKAHLRHGGQNTDPQSMENLRGYYFERVLWKELDSIHILTLYIHTLCTYLYFFTPTASIWAAPHWTTVIFFSLFATSQTQHCHYTALLHLHNFVISYTALSYTDNNMLKLISNCATPNNTS